VHTGAVVRLQAPPGGAGALWDACVLSVGADFAVCIVSLLQQSALRVFSGVGRALASMTSLQASTHRVHVCRLQCWPQRQTHTCCGPLHMEMGQRPLPGVCGCVPADDLIGCQNMVAGHPSVPSSAAWDPVRGYLACLCPIPTDVISSSINPDGSANGAQPTSSSAVAIVWDVHSGEHHVHVNHAVSSLLPMGACHLLDQ